MNTIKCKYLSLVSITLLTACAPPPVPMSEAPTNQTMPLVERQEKTKIVSSWEISGAIAAKSEKKSWTASLNWLQQGPNKYQLRLLGPLGGGTVIVERKGKVITYRDGPKQSSSSNADELVFKETGVRLPVNNLYYWVRGLPAPGAVESDKHDKYNHLTSLKQAGYTIDYLSYTSVGSTDLPSKIQLHGQGVVIKLVIKQWKI